MREHPAPALLYLMVAAQGVLGYGLASVFGAIPAELFQGKHYGTIFGTLSLASIVGGAIGPWVAGALHDRTGSYVLAFWIAIAVSAVSAGRDVAGGAPQDTSGCGTRAARLLTSRLCPIANRAGMSGSRRRAV